MALLSIYADTKRYRMLCFDREQSRAVFGDNIANQFDVNFEAKSYKNAWQPLDVSFVTGVDGGESVPDISEHNGRLYLNDRAFQVLKDTLSDDGEFLPVRCGESTGYLFNPLRIAEDVGGLDRKLSVKNEWGDLENIAFHEGKVSEFTVFRSRFDNYRSLYCQSRLRDIIEDVGLKGVFFTPDLGNPFTLEYADRLRQG
ncbi:hypothetical protein [Microbulbifer sp.]|uniref:hypothetical protein n=1 Tax=Microbulbifer sp. TaxID=1908541 RepID=UPI003F2F9624